MAWAIPPVFSVGTGLSHVPLQLISSDLTELNASPQIASVAASPLVGVAPSVEQPNFLLDLNYQRQITNSSGLATFNFGAAFPNGVLIVVPVAGAATVPLGLRPCLSPLTVTLSTFSCICYCAGASNTYVIAASIAVTIQWIAIGF
jgi:hypothetical protein